MALTARDVMTTEMITVTPATPLSEFARICAEDHISGAPVTRVDGSLVGIVSKTDLIERLLDGHPKFGTQDDFPVWDENISQVADIMQEAILTVGPDTPVWEVARRMARDRYHRVLVLEEDDKLVGIVTSIDILERFPEAG